MGRSGWGCSGRKVGVGVGGDDGRGRGRGGEALG